VTRSELVNAVSRRVGRSREETRQAVDTVLRALENALRDGRRVELRGLGTLRPRYYPGYIGRDPRTGDNVEILAKVMPVFRPSRTLLSRLNESSEVRR